jgi:hypothetical protein
MKRKGWLFKKGGNNTAWKRRWFVLENGELSYYRSEKDRDPAGSISIAEVLAIARKDEVAIVSAHSGLDSIFSFSSSSSSASANNAGTQKLSFCFDVSVTNGRTYYLCAESESDRASWLSILEECLNVIRAVSVFLWSKWFGRRCELLVLTVLQSSWFFFFFKNAISRLSSSANKKTLLVLSLQLRPWSVVLPSGHESQASKFNCGPKDHPLPLQIRRAG